MTNKLNIFNNALGKVNILLIGAIAFLIPIHHKYLSPFIALWAVTSIILIIVRKQKVTLNKSLLSLIGFYIFLIIGLLWTSNQRSGGFDLEVKMSLIIFPFLFLFLKYSKAYIRFVLYAFIAGILVGASYLFFQAFLNYQVCQAVDSFFYINLSTFIHPSYLSFYVVTAIMVLLVDLKYRVLQLFKNDIFPVIIIFIMFIFNILLLSKIGIIVGVLFFLFFIVMWAVHKKQYILGIGISLILIFGFYMSYQKTPYVKQRVNELIDGLTAKNTSNSDGSTGIRIRIWKEGLILIKEQPIFGHGTGDVKDVLMFKYQKNGIDSAYNKKLNAHNQFIQVTISLGFLGLTLFLLVYYFGIVNGIKNSNYFVFSFVIIAVLFMLPESVLENQAGTIFFGLFISLLSQKSLQMI